MNNITLLDVATKAGVSTSTVSRVLRSTNPKNPNHIKIQEIAKDLGYDIGETQYNIGFISIGVHNIEEHTLETEFGYTDAGLFSRLINSIERNIESTNSTLSFYKLDKGNDTINKIKNIVKENNLDGVIFTLNGDFNSKDKIHKICPAVEINAAQGLIDGDCIASDDCSGIMNAVNYLVSLNHKKIALFMELETIASEHHQVRENGYLMAIRKNNLSYSKIYGEAKTSSDFQERVELGLKEYIETKKEDRPTAMVFVCDVYAIPSINFLLKNGVNIPEDLSIIGFDNIDYCNITYPSLTSVDANFSSMGQEALDLLLDKLNNPTNTSRQIIIKSKLIKRNSCIKIGE